MVWLIFGRTDLRKRLEPLKQGLNERLESLITKILSGPGRVRSPGGYIFFASQTVMRTEIKSEESPEQGPSFRRLMPESIPCGYIFFQVF